MLNLSKVLVLGLPLLSVAALAQPVIPGCPSPGSVPCTATQVFRPAATATLSAATSSSNVAFPATGAFNLMVTNGGGVMAYIATGGNSVVATTSNMPVQPGQTVVLPQGNDGYIAGITASGSTILTLTSGTGQPVLVYGQIAGTVNTATKPITWNAPAQVFITTSGTVMAAGSTVVMIQNNTAAGGGRLTLNLTGGTAVANTGITLDPGSAVTVSGQPTGAAITGICSTGTCTVGVQSGS